MWHLGFQQLILVHFQYLCEQILKIAMDEAKNNGSLLPITELVDKYYGEVQEMGGNRWDTSSLIRRFRK